VSVQTDPNSYDDAVPPEGSPQPGTLWQHYKGGIYRVHHVGRHSETEEWLVAYEPFAGVRGRIRFRPLEMWAAQVEVPAEGGGSEVVTRFTEVTSGPAVQATIQSHDGWRLLGDLLDTGIVWLLNTAFLHPLGYAFAITYGPDGTAYWMIIGDGAEAFTMFTTYDAQLGIDHGADPALMSRAIDIDERKRAFGALLVEARELDVYRRRERGEPDAPHLDPGS
jgi:hypothetical protein